MHMADALVSPAVGGIMLAASAGAIAYSAYKCKDDLDEKEDPVNGCYVGRNFCRTDD